MGIEQDVLDAEQRFFSSLIEANRQALDDLLADDFTIVDIMAGNVIPKQPFVDFVAARAVSFYKIDRLEVQARFYGDTAIIVGRTRMEGSFQNHPFQANSRYTHVFVKQNEKWRLAAAQGTRISDEP